MTGNRLPTELDGYEFVTPIEGWTSSNGMTINGDVVAVLGFQVRGAWGGVQLPPAVASDIARSLGEWLFAYVAAHDDTADEEPVTTMRRGGAPLQGSGHDF